MAAGSARALLPGLARRRRDHRDRQAPQRAAWRGPSSCHGEKKCQQGRFFPFRMPALMGATITRNDSFSDNIFERFDGFFSFLGKRKHLLVLKEPVPMLCVFVSPHTTHYFSFPALCPRVYIDAASVLLLYLSLSTGVGSYFCFPLSLVLQASDLD